MLIKRLIKPLAIITTCILISTSYSHAELVGESWVTPNKNPDLSVEMYEGVELIGYPAVSHMDKKEIVDFLERYFESIEIYLDEFKKPKSIRDIKLRDINRYVLHSSYGLADSNYRHYWLFINALEAKYNLSSQNVDNTKIVIVWFFPDLVEYKFKGEVINITKKEKFDALVVYETTSSSGKVKTKYAMVEVQSRPKDAMILNKDFDKDLKMPLVVSQLKIIDYSPESFDLEIKSTNDENLIAASVGKYFVTMYENINKHNSNIIWSQLGSLLTENIKDTKAYLNKIKNEESNLVYIKNAKVTSAKDGIFNVKVYFDIFPPTPKLIDLEEAVADIKIDLSDVSHKSSFKDIINHGKVLEYSISKE